MDIPLTERAGGVKTYIYSVSNELARMGCKVAIVDGSGKPRVVLNRHFVKTLDGTDIHHFHEPSTAYPASFMNSKRDICRVITYHAPVSDKLLRGIYSLVVRLLYRQSYLVLTTTKRNADILKSSGVNAHVVPLWADEFFKPSDKRLNNEKPYVLSICVVDNFHGYKNYPMISRLGRLLQKRFGIRLLHVGLRDVDLPYVQHVGVVDRSALRELYQNALALVLPSIGPFEGFGLVAAEALACGTPVLVSDGCGISEFLQERFVSSLDGFEDNFSAMVSELLKDPREMRSAALTESMKFSYENCRKTARLIIASS